MMVYNHPMIQGLWLIKGLCKGVLLGKDVVAEFPSLYKLPHMGNQHSHNIIFHQSRIQFETILIKVKNFFKGTKVEDVANFLLGSQVYVGYPFLWEAKVKAILESIFY